MQTDSPPPVDTGAPGSFTSHAEAARGSSTASITVSSDISATAISFNATGFASAVQSQGGTASASGQLNEFFSFSDATNVNVITTATSSVFSGAFRIENAQTAA